MVTESELRTVFDVMVKNGFESFSLDFNNIEMTMSPEAVDYLISCFGGHSFLLGHPLERGEVVGAVVGIAIGLEIAELRANVEDAGEENPPP